MVKIIEARESSDKIVETANKMANLAAAQAKILGLSLSAAEKKVIYEQLKELHRTYLLKIAAKIRGNPDIVLAYEEMAERARKLANSDISIVLRHDTDTMEEKSIPSDEKAKRFVRYYEDRLSYLFENEFSKSVGKKAIGK